MAKKSLLSGFPEGKDGLAYRPCVGIVLINSAGLVWIGKRDDGTGSSNYDYAWQMPQGGIDAGEDSVKAAFRELYEETSVKSVSLLAETKSWLTYDYPPEVRADTRRGKHCGQAQRWYAMRFEGTEAEIEILTPPDGHSAEFSAWRWETADKLPDLIVPFKRDVYVSVLSEFKDYLA